MYRRTLQFPATKLYAQNVTTSGAITPSVPTKTKPTAGVIDWNALLGNPSRVRDGIPDLLELAFFGTRAAADNETLNARVERWRRTSGGLLVPLPALLLAGTLGTQVGVANSDVVNTEYFADTLTASGDWTAAKDIASPADNSIASVILDVRGCEFVTVLLSRGTCASCNCLWSAC